MGSHENFGCWHLIWCLGPTSLIHYHNIRILLSQYSVNFIHIPPYLKFLFWSRGWASSCQREIHKLIFAIIGLMKFKFLLFDQLLVNLGPSNFFFLILYLLTIHILVTVSHRSLSLTHFLLLLLIIIRGLLRG